MPRPVAMISTSVMSPTISKSIAWNDNYPISLDLEIDDALPDALRDLVNPDAVETIGSQYFDFSAEELFELTNEPDEIVVRRMLELYKKVDVSLLRWRAIYVGAEEPDPVDRIIPQQSLVVLKSPQNPRACQSRRFAFRRHRPNLCLTSSCGIALPASSWVN